VEYRQIGKDGRLHLFAMALVSKGFFFPTYLRTGRTSCTSVQCSQAGEPSRDRERSKAQQIEMESISHTTWGLWGGERKDHKKGNPEGCQQTTNFWVPSSLKEFLAFTFTFLFLQ
jgi:hypothetical protein